MIDEHLVKEIFQEYLPEDVTITLQPRMQYIESLRQHDYIRKQIDVGIYTDDNLENDLLSAVSSYVFLRQLRICFELLHSYREGVPEEIVIGYLRAIALHESYHFQAGPAVTPDEHAHQEKLANEHVQVTAPELWDLQQQFEKRSPVHQRVYARMRHLGLMT